MKTAIHILHRIENAVLVFLLLAMILLAGFDILARTLWGSGVLWIPPLLRVLVLWLGLLGALYATRTREHIAIDVLSRWVGERSKHIIGIVTSVFAAIVSGLIAWHSHIFVSFAYEMNDIAFNQIPAWLLQSIIPISFALMTLRFIVQAGQDIRALVQGETA